MKIIKKSKSSFVTLGVIIFTSLISGCVSYEGGVKTNKMLFSLQAGTNKGGITENTEIAKTNNVNADAFSGATNTNKKGLNGGIHLIYTLKKNRIETGIDIMTNYQELKYNDLSNYYVGTRKIDITQLMIPLTYNFDIFKKYGNSGLFQVKLGGVIQYNFLEISNYGILPEYGYFKISGGFTVGFRFLPLKLKGDKIFGFYLDAYGGSQIFDDFYNKSSFEIPGSSFSKFGIFFQF